MDKVAVSRAVARLVAARRVAARAAIPTTRAASSSRSRAAGASVHARIAPIALESEQRLLTALDARERAQLDGLIDRLSDAARRL